MHSPLKTLCVVCATATLSAAAATAGTVTGTVTYLERIALPPSATLTVKLADVSRADAPSQEISTKVYALNGVPHSFSLEYDDNIIDPRFSYNVSAIIELEGKVAFRTTTAYPVITRDATTDVDIVVEKMQSAPAPLANTNWVVSSIGGRMIVADRVPTIEFAENGAFGIKTTCNNMGGEAEIGDGTIKFPASMPTTMMACEEPYNKFEIDIREALLQVTGYTLNDKRLAFTNEAGVVVMDMQMAE